jgi:hypothetical protein
MRLFLQITGLHVQSTADCQSLQQQTSQLHWMVHIQGVRAD